MKSLSARLLAILVLVTLGIQVLSFGGVLLIVGREGRSSMYEFLGRDVQTIQEQLQHQSPAEREAYLSQLNQRGQYRLTLEDRGGSIHEPLSSNALQETAEVLRRHLNPLLARPHTIQARPILWQAQGEALPAIELPFSEQQYLIVSFPSRKPPFAPPSMGTVVVYLLVVSSLIMAAAWWAVRLAIKPLTRLAGAAQLLGQNLNTPALPEEGPSEVRRASSAFNTMQRAIQSHLNERTQILASISHDLKTPLTRMRLRVANFPDSNERQRLERDIDAMNLLIQEGLDYAHSSQLREAVVNLDLNMLAETLSEHYADMGHEVQVQGRIKQPVRCAPRALERALQNLIDNAIKYGERASIILADTPQGPQIHIEDDGPGLPDDLLEKVFEPFYRTEASRSRDTGGTGLGLAIAKNLLHAQGADVSLLNRTPHGLVARVVLCLSRAKASGFGGTTPPAYRSAAQSDV